MPINRFLKQLLLGAGVFWLMIPNISLVQVYGQTTPVEEQQIRADQLVEAGWQSLYELEGDPLTFWQQALSIYQDIGDQAGESGVLNALGYLYDLMGQPRQALEHYQQALAIATEIHNGTEQSRALQGLGDICRVWGIGPTNACHIASERDQHAINLYQQAVEAARDVSDLTQEANALRKLGGIYQTSEKYGQAVAAYERTLVIWRETEVHPWHISFLLKDLAPLYTALGQDSAAIAAYAEFVAIMETFRARLQELPAISQQEFAADFLASTYRAYANLLLEQGQPLEAQQVLELLQSSP